jgi:thymidylate synthase
MNYLDRDYQKLLQDILEKGIDKTDRTGTGTKSIFGRQIRHNMKDGFPLLTTKKMHWNSIVTELLWFLRGDTNIKYLVDNGCHIWDGDAYKRYYNSYSDAEKSFQYEGSTIETRRMTKEEFIEQIKTDDKFASKWGELGPIYGKQWRKWETDDTDAPRYEHYTKYIDQIANSINLLKTDPDSRRNKVSAWNVGELDQMVLPPCHTDFQFYTRELSEDERFSIHKKYITEDNLDLVWEPATKENLDKLGVPSRAISLMWNQRSVDTFLGLPFNIASYGLLLEIIAKEVNMVPDELIGNLGDVHLYNNHIEQTKEQINRTSFELPTLKHKTHLDGFKSWLFDETYGGIILRPKDFILENYQSHPAIKAPLSN